MRDTLSDSREHVERARRYRLQLGIEYGDGTRVWRYGRTRDISASGVLFEILSEESRAMQVNAPIEMTLLLPADIVGEARSRVICTGRIARIVRRRPSGRTYVAATIDRHRLDVAGAERVGAPSCSSTEE